MANNIYTFKVSLRKEVYRVIEIKDKASLYEFAEIILDSFKFDMDHLFGFFNNIKNVYKSDEKYELNDNFFDEQSEPDFKDVHAFTIDQVFVLKKKMVFLFDYGDCWEFLVECKNITESIPKKRYPKVIEKVGKAPEQYPDFYE